MAGKNSISSDKQRAKLKSKNEPYWHKISPKKYLGYRVNQASGVWLARYSNRRKVIGDDTLSFDDALKLAIQFCDENDATIPDKHTIQSLIALYCDDISLRKSPDTGIKYLKRYNSMLTDSFRSTDLLCLTSDQIEQWRNSRLKPVDDIEAHRKSKSTSRRDLSQVKALLNFAKAKGIIDNSSAWDRVQQFNSECEGQRTLYLTDTQIKQIINQANGDFKAYIQITLLLGCRSGEASDLKVSDFDIYNKTVVIGRKVGKRICYLNDTAVKLIITHIKDKAPTALIFTNEGTQWTSDPLTRAFKKLRTEINLPDETVLYSLRHYTLSKQVEAGLPLLAIAKNAGTSIAMIEKHYGHFAPDVMRDLINSVEIAPKM